MTDVKQAPIGAEIVPSKFKQSVELLGGEEVTGTANSKSLLLFTLAYPDKFAVTSGYQGFSLFDYSVDPLKSAAVYDACRKSGADILVAPRFTEERFHLPFWIYNSRKVVVKGIPAKVAGIEEIPIEKWKDVF